MAIRSADGDLPETFRRAVSSLRTAPTRPDVSLHEDAAPSRLAPYAVSLAGEVTGSGDEEPTTGRLIVLHDPAGQEGWEATTRLVAFVRANTDLEMAADPLLPAVAWSWLLEALAHQSAAFLAPAGTVTRVASERFGSLAGGGPVAAVELRASWSPVGEDLGRHLAAWADVLCMAAGLPPVAQGVLPLPERRPVSERPAGSLAGARRRPSSRSRPRAR